MTLLLARGVEVVHADGDVPVRALAGVSFAVGPDESVALVGRSGSGKTTLLHVLAGFAEPSAGFVERHGSTAVVLGASLGAAASKEGS